MRVAAHKERFWGGGHGVKPGETITMMVMPVLNFTADYLILPEALTLVSLQCGNRSLTWERSARKAPEAGDVLWEITQKELCYQAMRLQFDVRNPTGESVRIGESHGFDGRAFG